MIPTTPRVPRRRAVRQDRHGPCRDRLRPSGTWQGSYSADTTPEGYASLGLLYLRGGEWDGEQIVPEEWVEISRTPSPRSLSTGPTGGSTAAPRRLIRGRDQRKRHHRRPRPRSRHRAAQHGGRLAPPRPHRSHPRRLRRLRRRRRRTVTTCDSRGPGPHADQGLSGALREPHQQHAGEAAQVRNARGGPRAPGRVPGDRRRQRRQPLLGPAGPRRLGRLRRRRLEAAGVYDGDGSAFGLAGPPGSAAIEALFGGFYADFGHRTGGRQRPPVSPPSRHLPLGHGRRVIDSPPAEAPGQDPSARGPSTTTGLSP